MGGIGSGRPAQEDRVTAESCRALDVNQLNRAGCLKPGWAGAWGWAQDGEQVASVRLRAEEGPPGRGSCRLSFQLGFSDQEQHPAVGTKVEPGDPCEDSAR